MREASVPLCPHCNGPQIVNVRYTPGQVPVQRVICLVCGAAAETPAPDWPAPQGGR